MKQLDQLSVFLPAYNEEKNIEATILNVLETLKQVSRLYEIIVVDDGSTDATVQRVLQLRKKINVLRLLKHKTNQGYGAAIKTGLKACRYQWIAYIDSDGQFDFSEITKLLKLKNSADLIIGYRRRRFDSGYRRILQKILRLVGLSLFGINVKDVDCGFKLIKKKVIKAIFPLVTNSAITETELIVRSDRAGFKIKQVAVNHHLRVEGEQTGGKLKVIWRAAQEGIKLWWLLLNKYRALIGLAIAALAIFLRFYKIRDYLIFLGDEGRDVLVVKRMLFDHKWTLLGPTASVGGFYLGPIYYYFMLPFLWLSRLDPVGPALMVAIVGSLTVGLVYLVGRRLSEFTGVLAALFYAAAPLIVNYSRSSWNPNLVPFFSLMIIYLLNKAVRQKKTAWWLWAGVCLGISWQLHYLTLILLPLIIFAGVWLMPRRLWLKAGVNCLLGTLLAFSPYLFFELRHGFPNSRTIFRFITQESGAIDWRADFTDIFLRNSYRLLREMFLVQSDKILKLMTLLAGLTAWGLRKKASLLSLWLVGGLLILAFYRGAVYDYYFGWLFPVVIILAASFVNWFWQRGRLLKALALVLIVVILNNFYQGMYWHQRPSKMIDQAEELAAFVLDKTKGEAFNFALISGHNSDHAYRYFFEIWNQPPLGLEEQVVQQLMVICEMAECQPLGHPLWEIAGFGRAEISGSWTVGPEFKIYRLVHHTDSVELIGQPAIQGG